MKYNIAPNVCNDSHGELEFIVINNFSVQILFLYISSLQKVSIGMAGFIKNI